MKTEKLNAISAAKTSACNAAITWSNAAHAVSLAVELSLIDDNDTNTWDEARELVWIASEVSKNAVWFVEAAHEYSGEKK